MHLSYRLQKEHEAQRSSVPIEIIQTLLSAHLPHSYYLKVLLSLAKEEFQLPLFFFYVREENILLATCYKCCPKTLDHMNSNLIMNILHEILSMKLFYF